MIELGVSDRPKLDALIDTLTNELRHDYAPPNIKRDAHPKMHGCVQAVLRVDTDVPEELRYGVFAHPGREYLAWVRFSNAFGIQHDLKYESRGMAIKLLEVDGERLLPNEPSFALETHTQDFLMATFDAFVLPNTQAYNYADFARAARVSPFALVRLFIKKGLWRGLIALLGTGVVLARNPLSIPYFSQTPYMLGPELNVKLHARPCLTPALTGSWLHAFGFRVKALVANLVLLSPFVPGIGPLLRLLGFSGTSEEAERFCERYLAPGNLLRQAMSVFLANSDAHFEIMVQKRTCPASMPIDDATVRWSQHLSKFQRIATLTIPRQVFWPAAGMPPKIRCATIAMVNQGENMSFTPWHGIAAHEPLGDINKARGRIYAAMSTFRRRENKVPLPDLSVREYERLRAVVQHGLMEPSSQTCEA